MIKADVSQLQKSLEEAKKLIQARLENMVAGFAADVAESASMATRKGDTNSLETNPVYRQYYIERSKPSPDGLGLPVEVGYHRGAWTYSEGGDLVFKPVITDAELVPDLTLAKAKAQYKLGDDFKIGAVGPAFGVLQAQDDIEGTAIQTLMQVYRSDLQRYYDQSNIN